MKKLLLITLLAAAGIAHATPEPSPDHPAQLGYRQAGMRLVELLVDEEPVLREANLEHKTYLNRYATLISYVETCVKPGLAKGALNLSDVILAFDLFRAMRVDDSVGQAMLLPDQYSGKPGDKTVTLPCGQAWETINEERVARLAQAYRAEQTRGDSPQRPHRDCAEHCSHTSLKHKNHCCPTKAK